MLINYRPKFLTNITVGGIIFLGGVDRKPAPGFIGKQWEGFCGSPDFGFVG